MQSYGTTQFKLDTRVQQKWVCSTDVAKSLASGLHADCMAYEYAR